MNSSTLFENYPELSRLSRDDLQDLLHDQQYFQATFHSLEHVKTFYRAQDEIVMANEAIAKNNLSLQDELYKLRAETQAAFDESRSLEARWKSLEREQKEVYQRFTQQFLLLRLRHAATAQDEASEKVASDFVKGPSDGPANGKEVDDFVKDFREMRRVYHKRAIFVERWTKGDVGWLND